MAASTPRVAPSEEIGSPQPLILQSFVEVLDRWNELGVDDAALAAGLNVPPAALSRWRRDTIPQKAARRKLAELGGLYRDLFSSFEELDSLTAWLHADAAFLGGMKPVEALRAGRIDRVRAALVALDSGIFA
jgi:hypothetical protein